MYLDALQVPDGGAEQAYPILAGQQAGLALPGHDHGHAEEAGRMEGLERDMLPRVLPGPLQQTLPE